jgi:D-sedoheptulose 7-phosphate isomerase
VNGPGRSAGRIERGAGVRLDRGVAERAEDDGARPGDWVEAHLAELDAALVSLRAQAGRIQAWGSTLAELMVSGNRLLVAGNGGSAAEAQHLSAELVGRFQGERRPLSALCLSAETSSLTAILNDYGAEEVFARQLQAHGRPDDVLILLSTSGRSPNVLLAAERAREIGVRVWAMTGPAGNPLAERSDEAFCVEAPSGSVVQEVHMIAVHGLCAALDARLAALNLTQPPPVTGDRIAPPGAPGPIRPGSAPEGCAWVAA